MSDQLLNANVVLVMNGDNSDEDQKIMTNLFCKI